MPDVEHGCVVESAEAGEHPVDAVVQSGRPLQSTVLLLIAHHVIEDVEAMCQVLELC